MSRSILTGFGFFSGVFYPFLALKIIWQNKTLWQYLIIPILINILVGITSYILLLNPSLNFYDNFTNNLILRVDQLIDNLPQWLDFLTYIIGAIASFLKGIIIVILLILVGFIILQFGGILGSPFYGKLSEKVEILKKGNLDLIEINIVKEIFRAILFELKKLLFIIVFSIPLFLLNFIPAFGNLISLIGGLSITITIICLDFFDATLERKRLSFREKLKFVWGGFPLTTGFGLICLALISIPLVNLIAIPICVSAGTLLICEYNTLRNNRNIKPHEENNTIA
ncbi:EI24 domain-containing protein [Cyanobacterium sp. DS4]|uniref:EI24 domain-containing protein n=1 Tax=Cyanobacterium sp. DS4 TaxID=2878255 RepID=UPI002E7FB4B7|nr:EI24 domain-containing protein [Cyanobacterium sp. Dongsha4]WVK99199.1 EI24 domain-containing protein [Cyanobacterium sp. Dongsha4]